MDKYIIKTLKELTRHQNAELIREVRISADSGETAKLYGKSVNLTEWGGLVFLHIYDVWNEDFRTLAYHKDTLQYNAEKYKPKNLRRQTYNHSQDTYSYYGDCGNCGEEVDINYNTYCGACGKRVDWEE